MPDNRPRPTDRKRTLIAPLIIGALVLVLLLAAFLLRTPRPETPQPPPQPAAVLAISPPPLAVPPPPLGRRELIEAAALQAAAYSAGAGSADATATLVGRRFALGVPFGCDGPQTSAGVSQTYFERDPVKKTIKLVARPGDWTSLPIIQGLGDAAKVEKVEGFWLPRPWSFSENCPPQREAPVPPTPTPAATQSLGLARVFRIEGSRLLRRDGRAYEFVRKAPEGDGSPLTTSYRLVLEGRIVGFDDGRAVRCWSETSDHRPICLYGVEFDRVAFEDAKGAMLAEWRE